MTFAYYAGPDAVKGLQKFHDKGEKVTKNALKKLDRILLPEFYKKVAEVMHEKEKTFKSLQNSFDDIISDQWVSMHLDHPHNGQYVRPEKIVYHGRDRFPFCIGALQSFHFCSLAKDMRTRKEIAALGRPALKVTLGTWGYWRESEGQSRGPWPAWKSMIRAQLWQVAEKGKPASLKILNIHKLLGQEPTKSRVVPPAAGVTGDFKTVEQQDQLLASQTITIKAIRIAALAHDPPRRFNEIDRNLIVINGDIFEHLALELMCPACLYEGMARANTLICGSQTVVDNMFDVLATDTERRLNDDFNAPRMANVLRVPIFSWPVKPKPAGDPTTFEVCWLLILSPDSWSRKV